MNHRLVIRASLDGYFMYSFLGKSSINSVHVLALFLLRLCPSRQN
jgi:hypothetical protein